MGLKQWLKRKARSALGTQEILAALSTRGDAAAELKVARLYDRLLDPAMDEAALGFRKDHAPCLIDVNGDTLWLPGDLLPFIWHTHVDGLPTMVPRFLIETPHYIWIRERLRPGDVAFDCGSNIGLFSLMMGERVGSSGQVHAFEPSPGSCRDLGRVLRMNGLSNVVVNECALADTAGQAEFYDVQIQNVRRESSHLTKVRADPASDPLPHVVRTVRTTTLDDYATLTGATPRLIKIDVEGAEFSVLAGGRKIFESARPLLVIEFHNDDAGHFDHPRLEAFLRSYGYGFTADYKTYYCS
jgi:FkbM family methyltransferase